jgi:hypothetical protein
LVRTSALEDLHFKSVLITPLVQTMVSDKLLEESLAAGDLALYDVLDKKHKGRSQDSCMDALDALQESRSHCNTVS